MRLIEKMNLKSVGGDRPVVGVPALFSEFSSTLNGPELSYRMLGIGTDISSPPPHIPGRITRGFGYTFREKCESLALSGLVEGGINVIAPVEILKQIFRTPYSLYSPVSIAIQLVGQTLALSPGFDVQEQSSQPVDELFPNFVTHSTRIDGCGCLPVNTSENPEPSGDWEKHTKEFSRVVDCRFGEFQMRLGSDLVLFRNEKDEAISLHLWDDLQVQPLARLEAWLDNVMANVPKLAGCYHQEGLVKGYELTKTEDIYQPYGFCGDAPPAFDPNLVQQNALDVLKFLLSTCKEDPGVYWLYKSAGDNVIQLFDLTNKHSSGETALPQPLNKNCGRRDLGTLLCRDWLSSSVGLNDMTKWASFPSKCWNILEESDYLVVDAHEQFARLILNEEEFADQKHEDLILLGFNFNGDFSGGDSVSGGPVGQAAARCRISLKEAAVKHVLQAIESLKQLQSSKPSSELEGEGDKRMWRLVLLLGEAYLFLGEAYIERGELHQALNNVELACSIYGSVPHKREETWFESALHKTFAQQLKTDTFLELMSKLDMVSLYPEEAEPDYTSLTRVPSRCLFWAKAWLLVGEIYVNFHVLVYEGSDGTSINQQRKASEVAKGKKLALNPLKRPPEVAEELMRVKETLTALGQTCAACSLVSCSCSAKDRKRSTKPRADGGIFKYLKIPMKDGEEINLLAAIDCFEQTRIALQDLSSDCEEVKDVIRRKALVWGTIGSMRSKNKNFEAAEVANEKACLAFEESYDLILAAQTYGNTGFSRRERAIEIMKGYASTQFNNARVKKNAHKQAVEEATREYTASVKFYEAAVGDVKLATLKNIEMSKDFKTSMYTHLGDTYLCLGIFLGEENTSAHGLKTKTKTESSSLSATEAIEEAIDRYVEVEAIRDVAIAYTKLADYHQARYVEAFRNGSLSDAQMHALLAYQKWMRSVDTVGPGNEPSLFLTALEFTSDLSLKMPPLNSAMLTEDVSWLLEARHISEESLAQGFPKNFWARLQKNLKSMVSSKKGTDDFQKLKLVYAKAVRSESLSVPESLRGLNEMHELWKSI